MITWPLFWCLKTEDMAKLIQYQWNNYGTKLNIPPPPNIPESDWSAAISESLEEIDRLMREPPHLPERVN